MTDYQRQFDEAHEVLEIADSDGFKRLMQDVETQITSIESQVESLHKEMLRSVEDGIDPNHYVQKLIALNARKQGLQFISKRLTFFRKKRDEASNKLS